MLHSVTTKQFGKDVDLAKRRAKDLEKLRDIMTQLINEQTLAEKHQDHP